MNADQKLRQLLNRLQNASTSSERVDALYDLQGIARSNPAEVGSQGLPLILELLKDQGSVEEYQECLELISRLLKTNVDAQAAVANASTVVAETGNIEIFLDLLEHEDGLIGIMASDLLRDLHSLAPGQLETAIHKCPAGMNKLLQRVADRSREEVGNQALVLIQQLTLTNEEMKKTVAFNEGFDILFNIIVQEGGVSDPGVVVEDCLRVCCNILADSEICQRLFYSMGSSWRHTLVGFFDPEQLENSQKSYLEDEDEPVVAWFDQPTRLTCAVLSMTALINSLTTAEPASKHQKVLAKEFDGLVVVAAMHWCARNGPVDLIPLSLNLLKSIVINNLDTLEAVKAAHLVVKAPKKGLHVPQNHEVVALSFGNKLPGPEDRVAIAIPSLLVERYISNDSTLLWSNILRGQDTHTPIYGVKYAPQYLEALDVLLSGDPMSAGMILQHVLAPLPPSPEDDAFGEVDTGKPFGSLVLTLLVESCNKVLQHLNNTALSVTPSAVDISNAQKCANVFTLILIHGGALARELASAVHLSHIVGGSPNGNTALLPFLLSVIARVVRMPHGHGLSVSLLRLLCAAGAACETSCKLMLENPSNLFVVDLAVLATGEETSSVLYDVHSYCCFFLGTCLQALPEPRGADSAAPGDDAESAFHVSRKMLLDIIDSKIGLTRFTDVLKRRVNMESKLLSQSSSHDDQRQHALEHLRSATFLAFMNAQREAIRKAIYDHYSGSLPTSSSGNSAESSALSKIVELQKEEIARLSAEIAASRGGESTQEKSPHSTGEDPSRLSAEAVASLEGVIEELKAELRESRAKCDGFESDLVGAADDIISLNATIEALRTENATLQEANEAKQQSSESIVYERAELANKLAAAEERVAALEFEMNKATQKSLSDAATLMEKDNLISDLRDDIRVASAEWSAKLSTSEEEIANLRTEMAVLELRLSKPADPVYSPVADDNLSEQVIRLKEEIVGLSREKKVLKEDLEKATRSIELMEEELRGPIPYEKSRESKISDLESRNGALKKQIWQLEGELEASRMAAFDGCFNIAEALRPAAAAIADGFGDTHLLTLELDQNRESNTIGVEALAAFISSDINSCRDLVERRLNYALEYGSAAGISSSAETDVATLRGFISWVTGVIDASQANRPADEGALAPSVTAEIIENLQGEVDAAGQAKQDLEERCRALEDEVAQYQASSSVLESANASLASANSDLSARSGALEAEVSRLNERLCAIENVNASLLASNNSVDVAAITAPFVEEIELINRQRQIAEQTLETVQNEVCLMLSALGRAAGAGDSTQDLVGWLRTEVDGLVAANRESAQQLQKLNTDVVRHEQNAIIHEDELEQLKQQCADFYERTHEHDDLLSKFEQMVNDFSVAEEKITHFNEVVEKLKEDNRILEAQKGDIEAELRRAAESLTLQMETSQRFSDEVDRLKDVIASKSEQISEIEASKQASLNASKLQIIELEEKLMLSEAEKRDIENRSLSEKEPLAKVVASLRSERDLLKRELQSRDKEVKETASECASLAGRVAGFTAAFEGLQEEFESVREEKDSLEREYSQAYQRVSELTNANSLLEANVASRLSEIEELKAFLLFREKELEQKHRVSLVEALSGNREAVLSNLEAYCKNFSRGVDEKIALRGAQLDAMQRSLDNSARDMMKRAHASAHDLAELRRKLAQSEQQLLAKEQHIEVFKKNQNQILSTTKEVLQWASSCCNDVLSMSGVAPIPHFSNFETIPQALLYLRDQVDAAIDALQRANKELRAEVKQKNDALAAAHKKQARLEADLAEHKFNQAPSHGLPATVSTPQHGARNTKVNFLSATTPGPLDKALALSGNNSSTADFSATTPASASRANASPATKELTKLQSELRKERKRLHHLREQHEELLGLLAQQELEMKSFREKLYEYCGSQIVSATEAEIRREAVERYGSYIDFRQEDANASFEYGAASPGPLLSSALPRSPEVV